MLVSTAVDIFNILQDKYGSPNIINSEIIHHLNMGTSEYLNRMFPDSLGGVVNFEQDSNVTANLQPLIYRLGTVYMDANGHLSNDAINTALGTASGSDATYFRIGSIGTGERPVRYAKHNNIWAYRNNSFKAPSATNPYFSLVATGLQFYPTSVVMPLSITVIKNPTVLVLADIDDDEAEMEFDDYGSYNIIAIALKLASIGTRDTELFEDVRLAGLQLAN